MLPATGERMSERERIGLAAGFRLRADGLGLFTEPAEPPAGPARGGPGQTFSLDSSFSGLERQMIAVTGIDVTGSSILYVIDTQHRQLAVYQANAGSASTMGLRFVAGRNIDLDLQVWGYNDKSEHSYRQMVEQFDKKQK
jgi:hypothetical protein